MSVLHDVGEHLSSVAAQSAHPEDTNKFGRSAYNRYYYATFLEVRDLLALVDKKWEEPNHSDIPGTLRGKFRQKLLRSIGNARDTKLITLQEAARMTVSTQCATRDLAALMDTARQVRSIADYKPEYHATKIGGAVVLGGTKLSEARLWRQRACKPAAVLRRIANAVI